MREVAGYPVEEGEEGVRFGDGGGGVCGDGCGIAGRVGEGGACCGVGDVGFESGAPFVVGDYGDGVAVC